MSKIWDITPPDFDEDWMLRTITLALTFYGDMWAPMTQKERDEVHNLAEMYAFISCQGLGRNELISNIRKIFEERE